MRGSEFLSQIESWKEAAEILWETFTSAATEKGILESVESSGTFRTVVEKYSKEIRLTNITLGVLLKGKQYATPVLRHCIMRTTTTYLKEEDKKAFLKDEIKTLEWTFTLMFEGYGTRNAVCMPVITRVDGPGKMIPFWTWLSFSMGQSGIGIDIFKYKFSPEGDSKNKTALLHSSLKERPESQKRTLVKRKTRQENSVFKWNDPKHPAYHLWYKDSALANQVMLQYLAYLAPEGTCILSTTLTYPGSSIVRASKQEINPRVSLSSLKEEGGNPECRLAGFLVFGFAHIYSAAYDKSHKKLEILNTIRTSDEEVNALVPFVAEAFDTEASSIKVEHLFDKGFYLQEGEETYSKGMEEVFDTTGGKGQCAFWALRLLYRRVILGCSLAEIRLYFEAASPVARIYSLKAFAMELQTQANLFSEGNMGLISDLPLDVPTCLPPRGGKRLRK